MKIFPGFRVTYDQSFTINDGLGGTVSPAFSAGEHYAGPHQFLDVLVVRCNDLLAVPNEITNWQLDTTDQSVIDRATNLNLTWDTAIEIRDYLGFAGAGFNIAAGLMPFSTGVVPTVYQFQYSPLKWPIERTSARTVRAFSHTLGTGQTEANSMPGQVRRAGEFRVRLENTEVDDWLEFCDLMADGRIFTVFPDADTVDWTAPGTYMEANMAVVSSVPVEQAFDRLPTYWNSGFQIMVQGGSDE